MKKFPIFLFALTLIVSNVKAQNATTIINTAQEKAAKENKHVFVKFSASWCGWCKKMDAKMRNKATKDFFEDNYVTVQLTVLEPKSKKNLETPGGGDILAKYRGNKQGLPFWVILDSKGTLIEDSFNEKGQNLGCPASKEEVAVFTKKLKNTSSLTDENLAVITEAFVLKK